jgi:hypothetical protein
MQRDAATLAIGHCCIYQRHSPLYFHWPLVSLSSLEMPLPRTWVDAHFRIEWVPTSPLPISRSKALKTSLNTSIALFFALTPPLGTVMSLLKLNTYGDGQRDVSSSQTAKLKRMQKAMSIDPRIVCHGAFRSSITLLDQLSFTFKAWKGNFNLGDQVELEAHLCQNAILGEGTFSPCLCPQSSLYDTPELSMCQGAASLRGNPLLPDFFLLDVLDKIQYLS